MIMGGVVASKAMPPVGVSSAAQAPDCPHTGVKHNLQCPHAWDSVWVHTRVGNLACLIARFSGRKSLIISQKGVVTGNEAQRFDPGRAGTWKRLMSENFD